MKAGFVQPTRQKMAAHDGLAVAYLLLAVVAGLISGSLGILVQCGMIPSGSVARYLVSAHGETMLLFVALPALLGGFGNAFLPRAIGVSAMALPKLDRAGFVAIALGYLLFAFSGPDGALAALLLWCVGMTALATDVVATLLDSRAGMVMARLPVFAWCQGFAACGLLVAIPILAASLTRLQDVTVIAAFMAPAAMVALASSFGLASYVISRFAGRDLAGAPVVIAVLALLAAGGPLVWAHGMFGGGLLAAKAAGMMPPAGLAFLAFTSMVFAVSWVITLWSGRVVFRAPMLWATGFLAVISAGWVAQLLHGTGLHAAVLNGTEFALFGGFYLWISVVMKRGYSEALARLHFGFAAIGALLSVGTGIALTIAGFAMLLSAVSFLVLVGQILVLRRPVLSDYWGHAALQDASSGTSPAVAIGAHVS